MAGLTLTGFEVKTLAQSKAELDELFKNTFGVSLGSEPDGSIPPDSVAGQLVGQLADREAEIWEVMQALSSSFDPDNATGKALVALCALTGTLPISGIASPLASPKPCASLPTPFSANVMATGPLLSKRWRRCPAWSVPR